MIYFLVLIYYCHILAWANWLGLIYLFFAHEGAFNLLWNLKMAPSSILQTHLVTTTHSIRLDPKSISSLVEKATMLRVHGDRSNLSRTRKCQKDTFSIAADDVTVQLATRLNIRRAWKFRRPLARKFLRSSFFYLIIGYLRFVDGHKFGDRSSRRTSASALAIIDW